LCPHVLNGVLVYHVYLCIFVFLIYEIAGSVKILESILLRNSALYVSTVYILLRASLYSMNEVSSFFMFLSHHLMQGKGGGLFIEGTSLEINDSEIGYSLASYGGGIAVGRLGNVRCSCVCKIHDNVAEYGKLCVCSCVCLNYCQLKYTSMPSFINT
jgi:hypothetical protein